MIRIFESGYFSRYRTSTRLDDARTPITELFKYAQRVTTVFLSHKHDELNDLSAYMPELGCPLGEELLRPTRVYVKPLLQAVRQFGKAIKGICNITGGGLYENIPRMLPEGIMARLETSKFQKMPIFDVLAHKGGIPRRDMYNTFNMGVGLALAVSAEEADAVVEALRGLGEAPSIIGECIESERGVQLLW